MGGVDVTFVLSAFTGSYLPGSPAPANAPVTHQDRARPGLRRVVIGPPVLSRRVRSRANTRGVGADQ